jgi:hypothetical protein
VRERADAGRQELESILSFYPTLAALRVDIRAGLPENFDYGNERSKIPRKKRKKVISAIAKRLIKDSLTQIKPDATDYPYVVQLKKVVSRQPEETTQKHMRKSPSVVARVLLDSCLDFWLMSSRWRLFISNHGYSDYSRTF